MMLTYPFASYMPLAANQEDDQCVLPPRPPNIARYRYAYSRDIRVRI